MKLSERKARSLELFIRTLDRFGLMEPYIITIEMKPRSYLNKFSAIEYEQPERVYGVVIRIMTDKGITKRITIDDEDEDEA